MIMLKQIIKYSHLLLVTKWAYTGCIKKKVGKMVYPYYSNSA